MRKHVLIVEDSRTQAEALQLLLAERGYHIEVATSGEEGLRSAQTTRFDLVMSDVLMPGLSGYELCRQIKGRPDTFGSPTVVLLTSLGDPVYIVRGLESGADNYLTKPYKPERLLARIDQILEEREVRREQAMGEGVGITLLGERFTIEAGRGQILNFFLSSFEELIETNRALQESEQALQQTVAREQAARRAAEAATMARDVVLATVSHDLRNPLNTILMSTSLITDFADERLEPKVRDRVEVIRRVAQQMNRLIQDLLEVATIEAGGMALERSWQDPAALAREGLEMLEPIAMEQGLRIDDKVPDNLPRICIDRARVLQVISNLIGNAIKFTPQGGRITLGARITTDELVYSVSDNGPGIPADNMPHIFDRFWRNERSNKSGAGLGLSIAKGVIEAHGGRIWAESELGTGSTFQFSLPLTATTQHEVVGHAGQRAAYQSS
jgi:signal transduction histidine kinase